MLRRAAIVGAHHRVLSINYGEGKEMREISSLYGIRKGDFLKANFVGKRVKIERITRES